MKNLLNSVINLQTKYIELPDYKKFSCVNIDVLVPEVKLTSTEVEEGASDSKLEQIRLNKRKRRRFKNSFFNAQNLIQWTEEELS